MRSRTASWRPVRGVTERVAAGAVAEDKVEGNTGAKSGNGEDGLEEAVEEGGDAGAAVYSHGGDRGEMVTVFAVEASATTGVMMSVVENVVGWECDIVGIS